MPQTEAADFTTNDARPVICQRCRESFQKETVLYYMRDNKPDGPGKYVCVGCRQYYLRKTAQRTAANHDALLRQVTPETPRQNLSDPAVKNIRKAVADAQRRGSNHPLRIGNMESNIHRGNDGGRKTSLGLPWPRSSSSSTHTSQSKVQEQRDLGRGTFRPLVLPKFVTNPKLPLNNGYQEAHQLYDEMRHFFAQKALAAHNNEVVVIKVTMMTLKPGNKNPAIVSNISETVNNIPLYIGARALKATAYYTLLPLFMKWSKDYPLSLDDLRLRTKEWVELIPLGSGDEDINAISSKFFAPRGKSKVIQFQSNKVLALYLELGYEQYRKALDHLDDLENEAIKAQQVPRKMSLSYLVGNDEKDRDGERGSGERETLFMVDVESGSRRAVAPNHASPAEVGSKRKRAPSQTSQTQSPPHLRRRTHPASRSTHRPSTPVPPPATERDTDKGGSKSPNASDVRRALQAQTALSKKNVRSILNTNSFKSTVYITSDIDFSTLIKDARCFHAVKNCDKPTILTLLYDSGARHKYGAFKRACFGHLDQPVLGGSSSVVIKQCFYNCVATGQTLPYDNHSQVLKLSSEINCLRWASALMRLVYDYVDKYTMEHGLAPFAVPRMRFVKNALAVVQESHDTFLLEEVIDEGVEGSFVKYIGNGSAKPFDFLDREEMHRAEFLCFCQHLQYVKTKCYAYVGDFQGGQHLLTDPQLITSPDLGHIFADGNLARAYTSFTSDHACNEFCTFFGLQSFIHPVNDLSEGIEAVDIGDGEIDDSGLIP